MVVEASHNRIVGGHFFYDVTPSIKDRDIIPIHDQDFSTRNRTEHMPEGVLGLADSEDLPGIQIALNAVNQIRARSYFDAVCIASFDILTADVELVAQYTSGMTATCYVEILARAPLIPFHAVNFHRSLSTRVLFVSSNEENESTHHALMTN